jgi:SAM-dependent methyltransferase
MERNAQILEGLRKGQSRILEVGPSFSPIAPRRDGWNTTIVDHCNRASLLSKYSSHPGIDLSAIEEVDVIWNGASLADAMGGDAAASFDALIASHVIEHIVDPVGFLLDAARLLKPSGAIVLAVPDKRLCFDCFRPVSTTGQLLEAHARKRTRHGAATVFDALAHDARPSLEQPSWARSTAVRPVFQGSLDYAKTLFEVALEPGHEYLDVHGWVFTPASFQLIVLELWAMGTTPWSVARVIEQEAVEFLVFLQSGAMECVPSQISETRQRLMLRQLHELREQADWILGRQEAVPQDHPEAEALLKRLEHLRAVLSAESINAPGCCGRMSK